jgi:pyruvate kinase
MKNDIDYIAASFIRKASDVHSVRDYCKFLVKDLQLPEDTLLPRIISKIENIEGLSNLESIIAVSDGIMVARGDLGMDIPMETLTNVQKDIINKCKIAGKPVIVATQMLESMVKNPRPTRAECTDVSNAVLDGADCVMVSFIYLFCNFCLIINTCF